MILDKKLNDKIKLLESQEQQYYMLGINHPEWYPLFHSLRFQPLEKLESILQTGYILPGKLVNQNFTSYTGNIISISLQNDDTENANHGDFISVMPYAPDLLEFDIFIKENLFLVLRGDIHARKTFYLNYNEYEQIMNSGIKLKNLYSYANEEYFVDKPISVDQIIKLGLFSNRINMSSEKINLFISQTIDILKQYNAKFDFEDFSNRKIYYSCQERTIKK